MSPAPVRNRPALRDARVTGGSQAGALALGSLLTLGMTPGVTLATHGTQLLILTGVVVFSYVVAFLGMASPSVDSGFRSLDRGNR